ncbi:hypothetical protein RLDS_11920 [Sphingobium lactosutens DS20]|uniref:Uncharacterized protein n=1 Tax=Sphingobium lactosutens DS20 TaxID=1331060 RepID=T0IYY9_9SPHN|nr:hypothetical protein RLDS_11920 [Sphingobium lactosutens DS20]
MAPKFVVIKSIFYIFPFTKYIHVRCNDDLPPKAPIIARHSAGWVSKDAHNTLYVVIHQDNI